MVKVRTPKTTPIGRVLLGVLSLDGPTASRQIDSEAVRQALIVLWEAADRICGKRLKSILPSSISVMERHGDLTLDPTVRQLLLAASPATIEFTRSRAYQKNDQAWIEQENGSIVRRFEFACM